MQHTVKKNETGVTGPKANGRKEPGTVSLVEKRENLRRAECAAKSGEYRNGKCYV